MSKSNGKERIENRGNKRVFRRGNVGVLAIVCCVLFTFGCRQDMQDQPKVKSYRPSNFYPDHLGMRPPVEGTVARGFLKTNVEFFTGKKKGAATTSGQVGPTPSANTSGAQPQGAAAYPDDIDYFPMPVNKDVVERGKQRFEIYCAVCHGLTGYGDGMIVRRGFRRAASFNDDRLRQAPVGHFFDAMTNGWGVMPSYAAQISPQDRWAIVAYIRALQLSQQGATQDQAGQTAAPAASPQQTPTQSGGHK